MSRKYFGRQKRRHYRVVCKGTVGQATLFHGKRRLGRKRFLRYTERFSSFIKETLDIFQI